MCEQIERIEERARQETRQEAAIDMYSAGATIEMIAAGLKESVEVIRSWVFPAKA